MIERGERSAQRGRLRWAEHDAARRGGHPGEAAPRAEAPSITPDMEPKMITTTLPHHHDGELEGGATARRRQALELEAAGGRRRPRSLTDMRRDHDGGRVRGLVVVLRVIAIDHRLGWAFGLELVVGAREIEHGDPPLEHHAIDTTAVLARPRSANQP